MNDDTTKDQGITLTQLTALSGYSIGRLGRVVRLNSLSPVFVRGRVRYFSVGIASEIVKLVDLSILRRQRLQPEKTGG